MILQYMPNIPHNMVCSYIDSSKAQQTPHMSNNLMLIHKTWNIIKYLQSKVYYIGYHVYSDFAKCEVKFCNLDQFNFTEMPILLLK